MPTGNADINVTGDVKQGGRWRVAVLLSGAGRTLENLLKVINAGTLPVEIVTVVSSVAGVRGLDVAKNADIPTATVTRKGHPSVESYSQALYDALEPHRPDLVVMAGFLRQMLVFPGWEGRILNIHPALLPEASSYAAGRGLYGERVHAAVLAHGDTITGATVHLVTDDYDEGPVLNRVEVPIVADDTPVTLGTRVFHAECDLYPDAIRRYIGEHPELRRL